MQDFENNSLPDSSCAFHPGFDIPDVWMDASNEDQSFVDSLLPVLEKSDPTLSFLPTLPEFLEEKKEEDYDHDYDHDYNPDYNYDYDTPSLTTSVEEEMTMTSDDSTIFAQLKKRWMPDALPPSFPKLRVRKRPNCIFLNHLGTRRYEKHEPLRKICVPISEGTTSMSMYSPPSPLSTQKIPLPVPQYLARNDSKYINIINKAKILPHFSNPRYYQSKTTNTTKHLPVVQKKKIFPTSTPTELPTRVYVSKAVPLLRRPKIQQRPNCAFLNHLGTRKCESSKPLSKFPVADRKAPFSNFSNVARHTWKEGKIRKRTSDESENITSNKKAKFF